MYLFICRYYYVNFNSYKTLTIQKLHCKNKYTNFNNVLNLYTNHQPKLSLFLVLNVITIIIKTALPPDP